MDREVGAIRLSAYANGFFGVLGIGFGLWLDSNAILLDGVFNAISLGMSLISIQVARMLKRPGDDLFPFGYAALEPTVNTTKAVMVVAVSIYALVGSIGTILDGGRTLQAGWAVVYAVIAVTGCFLVSAIQHRVAKETHSPLVAVDAKNWLINGAISSAVGLAFGLSIFMRGTALDGLVPYVDSLLVVLVVLISIKTPVSMALDGVADLLSVRPPPEELEALQSRFAEKAEDDFASFRLRVNRLGRTHIVVADVEVDPDLSVTQVDALRSGMQEHMEAAFPHISMAMMFHPAAAKTPRD